MKSFSKRTYLILLILLSFFGLAQSPRIDDLRSEIGNHNKLYKYETSIQLITDFIEDDNSSNYEKAWAYILKSYTYKRLFDYDETLKCLNQAEEIGRKSTRPKEIQMQVAAEKSFAYFDIQNYAAAKTYMNELKTEKYAYLKSEDIAYVIMQEGQIEMFEKDYENAEKLFDDAIVLLQKFEPHNLPVVYGKKVELYNKMGLNEKRNEAFNLGLNSAEKHKVLKYKIYMREVLAGQYELNKDYKNAFFQNKIIDSLSKIYDAEQHNSKLKLYEKQMETQKKEYELETNRKTKYFLIILSIILLILCGITLKLNSTNRQKRILLEKEYERIYSELKLLTEKLKDNETIENKLSQYNLTERQQAIIQLIQQGKTNKEIASELFISENTVKYHLKVIYDTLNIDNRNKLFQLMN